MFTTAYCGRLHADNVPNKLNGKKYPKYKKLHEINSLIFREMIQCIVKSLMYFPSMIPIVQKQPKNTSKNTSKRHECNGSYFCASSNCLRI